MLVDAYYKFIWIDVGGNGAQSDAQIFNASELSDCLKNGQIGFPDADFLPNDNQNVPYFILGDDAFALRTYLMKPFSHRNMTIEELICNYRISRGRHIAENGFGILAQRWQILLTTMLHDAATVRLIIETCVCLHNLMRIRYPALPAAAAVDYEDADHNIVPGSWRDDANMHEMDGIVGANHDTRAAKKQRQLLKLYFNSPAGSVPWQDRMIRLRE